MTHAALKDRPSLFSLLVNEPYGETTLGDILCAEISAGKLRQYVEQVQAKYLAALSAVEGEAVPGFRDSVLSSARFRAACYKLVGIVEGVESQGRQWVSGGQRMKDTPEWCAFYVMVANMRNGTAPPPQQADVVGRAIEYLRPHLEHGTFTAPDWAVQLASILTGGDGCGTPVPATQPQQAEPEYRDANGHTKYDMGYGEPETMPEQAGGDADMALVEEGLRYFDLAGDKGDKRYTAEIRKALAKLSPTPPQPEAGGGEKKPAFTTGHCKNHQQPGGCPLHNLHCGYPDCDRRPTTPASGGEHGC